MAKGRENAAMRMAYQITSRAAVGAAKVRYAPDPSTAIDLGCLAITEGEVDLVFRALDPTEYPITEVLIRDTLSRRAAVRREHERAGLPNPYRGAPF